MESYKSRHFLSIVAGGGWFIVCVFFFLSLNVCRWQDAAVTTSSCFHVDLQKVVSVDDLFIDVFLFVFKDLAIFI